MINNKVARMIHNGEPTVGGGIWFVDPFVTEIMSNAGFDWLFIDTEHGSIGTESLRNIILATKGTDTVPIVRVRKNDESYIKIALDLGAGGVVIPRVNSASDASRAVQASKYHPLGKRGVSPIRASDYFRKWDEYLARANEDTLCIVQIEDIEAIENLDEILEIEGVDGIFIGALDLSHSMGIVGQLHHPDLLQLKDKVMKTARNKRIPFGAVASSMEDFMELIEKGATLALIGSDLEFLLNTSKHFVDSARRKISKKRKL